MESQKIAEGGGRQNPCNAYKRRLLLNELCIKPKTEAFTLIDSTNKAEELLKAGFEL
jgi:hypothetical protein